MRERDCKNLKQHWLVKRRCLASFPRFYLNSW